MSDSLVSIDLGTTRLKVAAFTPTGELLQQVAIRHKEAAPGQQAEQWWHDAAAAIRRLAPTTVAGVSLSGRAGAGVFLNRAGEVVADTWEDQRHRSELEHLHAWRRQGSERFLSNYGAALVAKYLWLRTHHPDFAADCRHAMYAKDFLLYRLTGTHATDYSSGPDAPEWDAALLRDFDLPLGLLPRPLTPWRIAGHLTPAAARQTGLPAGTPVAVGAHDGICANVGAGATRPGDYAITLGTHAVVRTVAAEPPSGARRFYGLPPGSHIIGGNAILGGRSFDWLLDLTRGAGDEGDRELAYRQAEAAAEAVPPGADGVSFLPFLAGQVAPEHRPTASGAFAGLRLRHGRGTLVRAVLEGVTFAVADIFDEVVGWCGTPRRVRLTGGGAASALWRQILADVLGYPVEATDAAEGRGAAIFLAVALGGYADCDAAADAMVRVTHRATPARAGIYRDVRNRWNALREALRPLDEAQTR